MLDALEGEEMEEDMPAPGGDNGMMHDADVSLTNVCSKRKA